MYSFSKIQLTAEVAQAIVTQHFGSSHTLQSFEELKEGFFNAAARIELKDGARYVLKAAPPPEIQVLRYEKDILRAEVESMSLVRRQTGVPVPEIFCFDSSRQLLPSDFFIMAFNPDTPYHKLRASLPPETQAQIEREMGRLTRMISTITNDRFGYWSQPEAAGVSWRDCFTHMVNGVLQDGIDLDVKLPLPYEEVYRRMETHFDALEEVTTPRLVHWDLWDGNVFVNPVSHQVTGLIDFERVMWADPLIEAIFGNLNPDSPASLGYGGEVLRTENERRRRMLYNAYLFLIMIIEVDYRHYDNDWQINWATERFNELMPQFSNLS
jgi:aminoglycoside phosphotransferase (APT) family kinase protein